LKTEKRREEIEQLQEDYKDKIILEKEYIHEAMEKNFKKKQEKEAEEKRMEILKKKLEIRATLQRISNQSINEFNKLVDEKLEKLQEQKNEYREKILIEEKLKIDQFKTKILEINPKSLTASRAREEDLLKEQERQRQLIEIKERKEKLSQFLNHMPKIKVNEEKRREFSERINTIHSTSILRLKSNQRLSLKSRSKERMLKKRSKSPVLAYSDKIRKSLNSKYSPNMKKKFGSDKNLNNPLESELSTDLNNKSLKYKVFKGDNISEISHNLGSHKQRNRNNVKMFNDLISSKASIFSDTSSLKQFLQPLNTRVRFNKHKQKLSAADLGIKKMNSSKDAIFIKTAERGSGVKELNLPLITSNIGLANKERILTNTSKQNVNNGTVRKENIENMDILKMKAEVLENKYEQKEQLARVSDNVLENVLIQEDLADAMLNAVKYKMNILNNIK